MSKPNAASPLPISTYDGSGQAVHPCVVVTDEPFAGYRFWMALTPYPFGADRLENPCLRASHDGTSWECPRGVPDPLAAAPADRAHHASDPAIVIDGQMLHLFYRIADRATKRARIIWMSSPDARAWSPPRVAFEGQPCLSPSVLAEKDCWTMWFVDYPPGRKDDGHVMRVQGREPWALESPRRCELTLPGYVPWHLEVRHFGRSYEALVAAFPAGKDESRTRLFHVESPDGITFAGDRARQVLSPTVLGWDNRNIYKASFSRVGPDYLIWYSAASWGRRWGIGFVRGPLDRLAAPTGAAGAGRVSIKALLEDGGGRARAMARRVVPARLRRLAKGRR
jgi:hypothetical protein